MPWSDYRHKAEVNLSARQYHEAVLWCLANTKRSAAIWASSNAITQRARIGTRWTKALNTAAPKVYAKQIGKEYGYPREFFFKDADDAMMFRLRWN